MTIPQPTPPSGPYDPMFGLQEKVASLLTPVFQDAGTDELFAYQIACRSLQAYEPETRADFVNIARTIAFSLASLVLLKEAFNPALELEDKKRVAIHANALNRSADQAERSMMDRRRYRKAYPTFPVPQQADSTEAQAETAANAPPEPEVEQAHPARPAVSHPPRQPQPNRHAAKTPRPAYHKNNAARRRSKQAKPASALSAQTRQDRPACAQSS